MEHHDHIKDIRGLDQIDKWDESAYSKAYLSCYGTLFNYGLKLTDDTFMIEDAIQSLFIELWKNRQKVQVIHSLRSYLLRSLRNYIIKEKKRNTRWFSRDELTEFAIDVRIIDQETRSELHSHLNEALAHLTDRQREAVFLRFYQMMSYEEVASIMNISTKATYKLLARSLEKLRENMQLPTTRSAVIVRPSMDNVLY